MLCVLLSVGASSAWAKPESLSAEFYAAVETAESAESANRHRIAADAYARAYSLLAVSERVGEMGATVVERALGSYRDAFFRDPTDKSPLVAAKELLEQHALDLAGDSANEHDASEIHAALNSIDVLIEPAHGREDPIPASAAPGAVAPAVDEQASAPPAPRVPASNSRPKDRRSRDRRYAWGRYKPVPAWKWAGFGTSAAVAAGGIVMLGVAHGQRDTLLDAEACGMAAPGSQAESLCQEQASLRTLFKAGLGVMAVGVAGTLVFTTLLFVRRGARSERARWQASPAGLTFRFR